MPTSAQLLKSTIVAIVAIVLPSEYGIDPTGVGGALCLTEMGEIKTKLAEEAEQDRIRDLQNALPAAPAAPQQGSSLLDRIYAELLVGSAQAQETRSDKMSVTLASGKARRSSW